MAGHDRNDTRGDRKPAADTPKDEEAVDEVLDESFPASDPPGWSGTTARPEPPRPAGKPEDGGDASRSDD